MHEVIHYGLNMAEFLSALYIHIYINIHTFCQRQRRKRERYFWNVFILSFYKAAISRKIDD